MKFKKLTEEQWIKIINEVKMLLHASRDCYRNQGKDTTKMTFDVNDGYFGEAFGIFRGLAILKYGKITGAVNIPEEKTNFKWLLGKLENEVLAEENHSSVVPFGNNQCDYCLIRYGKDAVRKKY